MRGRKPSGVSGTKLAVVGVGSRRERREVAVGGGVLVAVIGGAEAVALAVGAEGVKLPVAADRHAGIDEEVEILGLGVAVAEFEPVEGQLARVEGRRRRPVVVGPKVVAGAVGRVAVAIFGGQVDEAAADRQADIGADRHDPPSRALRSPLLLAGNTRVSAGSRNGWPPAVVCRPVMLATSSSVV